jgi:hypothetical protein
MPKPLLSFLPNETSKPSIQTDMTTPTSKPRRGKSQLAGCVSFRNDGSQKEKALKGRKKNL